MVKRTVLLALARVCKLLQPRWREYSTDGRIEQVRRLLGCIQDSWRASRPILSATPGAGETPAIAGGYAIIADTPAAPLESQTVAQTLAEPGFWRIADGQACRRLVESGAGNLSSSPERVFRSCRYSEIHPVSKQKNGMPCAYRYDLTYRFSCYIRRRERALGTPLRRPIGSLFFQWILHP